MPSLLQQQKTKIIHGFDNFRHQLAYIDALPQLTILALICGIASALIIVAFRLLILFCLDPVLDGDEENFESLGRLWRFVLAFSGALVIGLCLMRFKKQDRSVSVSHVLERLHNHQGVMPWKNVAIQFFAGAACLISGQSVGREGPAVHLGAGISSLLGQGLKLPHNSLRILISCGVAAAISASFNTPMAGVIFAMEVVLMEYTITGFIPVIVASVVGAGITQVIFGGHNSFSVASVSMNSMWEIPFVIFGGIVIAAMAAIFYRLQFLFSKMLSINFALRMAIAGAATGVAAIWVPEIMGVGYDTLNQAMLGQISLQVLFLVIVAKLFCTTLSTGLGMPGGLIGPTLLIGGCVGAVLGFTGNAIFPEQASSPGFYVILGMAAMMAAVLNAPLAALVAIMELTYNPNMIFAGMLIIVVSCFIAQQFFKCNGIFITQLQLAGTPIKAEPAQQVLSRVGVLSVMNKSFVVSEQRLSVKNAFALLNNGPLWIVVEEIDKEKTLLRAADLAAHLNQYEPSDEEVERGEMMVDLLEIPGKRYTLQRLHLQANLYEAHRLLSETNTGAICVERVSSPLISPVMGIITQETIENYYSH